jgi:hypothetical protein
MPGVGPILAVGQSLEAIWPQEEDMKTASSNGRGQSGGQMGMVLGPSKVGVAPVEITARKVAGYRS